MSWSTGGNSTRNIMLQNAKELNKGKKQEQKVKIADVANNQLLLTGFFNFVVKQEPKLLDQYLEFLNQNGEIKRDQP